MAALQGARFMEHSERKSQPVQGYVASACLPKPLVGAWADGGGD